MAAFYLTIRVFSLMISLFCFSSCGIFLGDLGIYDQDLTDDPSFQSIRRGVFVAKEDLIIEKANDSKGPYLQIARPGVCYTTTAALYRQYGEDSIYHDERILDYRRNNGVFPSWKPIGIVDKGTRLVVSKITNKYSYSMGMTKEVHVIVLDGFLAGNEYLISCFLTDRNELPSAVFFELIHE